MLKSTKSTGVLNTISTRLGTQGSGSENDNISRQPLESPNALRKLFGSPRTIMPNSNVKGPLTQSSSSSIGSQDLGQRPLLDNNKYVIALLGPSGAGKSSFIAHATGQDVEIGHLLSPCTQEIKTYDVPVDDGKTVMFVDTPGYDLADKNPNRVLNMLQEWLKKQNTGNVKHNLNAILFFHRITDNRMPKATQSHIKKFEKLVGGKVGAPRKILLVTTMWSDINEKEMGDLREHQLRSVFWKSMIQGGSNVYRFDRSRTSAWDILQPLLGVNSPTQTQIPLPSGEENNLVEVDEEQEHELDGEQALAAMEQIFKDQQRLLEKLQVIVKEQSEKNDHSLDRKLKDVMAEEKKISGNLGSLLSSLKRQGRLRFFFRSGGGHEGSSHS